MKTIFELLEEKNYVISRINGQSLSIPRLELLIKQAISRMARPHEYRFEETQYFQVLEWPDDNHYQMRFHADLSLVVISSAIERTNDYSPIALFAMSDAHIACKFFVWLVSSGEVEIDWSLFIGI